MNLLRFSSMSAGMNCSCGVNLELKTGPDDGFNHLPPDDDLILSLCSVNTGCSGTEFLCQFY